MPNSFYRFQPAWNAGFYPDNQITANLLNTVSSDLATYLPTIASGIQLGQFKSLINTFINQYNVSPYFGDLSVSVIDSFCFPYQCYFFSIRNNSLFVVDNTQSIEFVAQFNLPDLTYSSYTLYPFTPGSYSGSFDFPAIPVEAEVNRALQIVEQNGSAFFPMPYSYDSITGIATSGLARGKNWQLDSSGNPVRLPADTLPKQNARTFNVSAQTAEDKYCISVMEKVINFSLSETDENLIQSYFNSFTPPIGWDSFCNIISGTYTRIFCVFYRADRALLMIGRLDTNWLWQRFMNESGSTDTTYFNAYASTTPLPYLPLASYEWLYGDWYDMEFVNFTDSCYVSPEFYAMPAIPGDNWQFNVADANLTGLDSTLVGLFSESGQFIQQIGDGIKPSTDCDCVPCALVLTYELTEAEWATYLTNVSQLNYKEAVSVDFAIYKNDVQVVFGGQTFINPPDLFTYTNIFDAGDAVTPKVVLTFSGGVYKFTINIGTADCGDIYRFDNQIIDASQYPEPEPTWITIFTSDSFECPNVANTTNQLNASCIIPAVKNGCYRLGLYEDAGVDGFYLYSLSNIINIDSADCFSTMLEFWANSNSIAQGFEYFNGWKQRIRIGLNGGGEKPKIEESMYRQSNGVHRRPSNKQDLSIDLHTDFFDLETQLAMTDATRHPYLVWNGQNIFVTGDIEVATIQDFTTQSSFETLSQMKFQALKQGFQPKNSSCLTC
jgi:hypothetical protein